MAKASVKAKVAPSLDPIFDAFAGACQTHFMRDIGKEGARNPLFCTDTNDEEIYKIYLGNLTEDQIQYHTCSCCKTFIRRYGNLVTIDDDGTVQSAIWDPIRTPDMYKRAATELKNYVESRPVTELFLSSDSVWGSPVTGKWTHFAIRPPNDLVFRRRGMNTASQTAAAKKEGVRILREALGAWSKETIKTALNLLETDSLYRAERVIKPVQFLNDLQNMRADCGPDFNNVVWLASVSAPPNFSQPRAGVTGMLLDDIQSGMPVDEFTRRFAAAMHPLAYMRPQAAPRAGNIVQAEKVIKELGLERSLLRRFARLEDLQTLWTPRTSGRSAPTGGVFSGVQARRDPHGILARPVNLPPQRITWVRFQRDVLPTAIDMSVLVTPTMNVGAFVTAVDPGAPPILQWDEEDARNPVSMYVYNPLSDAKRWGLTAPGEARVTAVSLHPSMWGGEGRYPHIGKCVAFILDGARDMERNHSLALFPETLKSDLHPIRATIEAFSKSASLEGKAEATACGLFVGGRNHHSHNIRVTGPNGSVNYEIDRWE